jgi:hypothetical protein
MWETPESETGSTTLAKGDSSNKLRLLTRRVSKQKVVEGSNDNDNDTATTQIKVLRAVTLTKLLDLVLPTAPADNVGEGILFISLFYCCCCVLLM